MALVGPPVALLGEAAGAAAEGAIRRDHPPLPRPRPARRLRREHGAHTATASSDGRGDRSLASAADGQHPGAGLQRRTEVAASGARVGAGAGVPALGTVPGRRPLHRPGSAPLSGAPAERFADQARPPCRERPHLPGDEHGGGTRHRRVRGAARPRRRPRPGRPVPRRRPVAAEPQRRPDLQRRGQDRRRGASLRPAVQARLVAGTATELQLRQPLHGATADAVREGRPLPPRVRGVAGSRPAAAGHGADRPRVSRPAHPLPLAVAAEFDGGCGVGEGLRPHLGSAGGRGGARPPPLRGFALCAAVRRAAEPPRAGARRPRRRPERGRHHPGRRGRRPPHRAGHAADHGLPRLHRLSRDRRQRPGRGAQSHGRGPHRRSAAVPRSGHRAGRPALAVAARGEPERSRRRRGRYRDPRRGRHNHRRRPGAGDARWHRPGPRVRGVGEGRDQLLFLRRGDAEHGGGERPLPAHAARDVRPARRVRRATVSAVAVGHRLRIALAGNGAALHHGRGCGVEIRPNPPPNSSSSSVPTAGRATRSTTPIAPSATPGGRSATARCHCPRKRPARRRGRWSSPTT